MEENVKETVVETTNEEPAEKKGKKKSKDEIIEIIVAIFLGITALTSAWASWIGSLHGGNQATNYTTSNNLAAEGNSMFNEASQNLMQDMMLWNEISSTRIALRKRRVIRMLWIRQTGSWISYWRIIARMLCMMRLSGQMHRKNMHHHLIWMDL